MNTISMEIPLGAPVARRRVAANGVEPYRAPIARSGHKRIWIIGSSMSAAESAMLLVLVLAAVFGIGICLLGSDSVATSSAPVTHNLHVGQ